jgi:hypothetical protein
MKKIIIFLAVFLYAQNPFEIIKEINSYKPHFVNEMQQKKSVKVIKKIKKETIKNSVKLYLDAIFNNIAYINSKPVKVGDRIYGYKVVKISFDRVILVKNGKIKILKIKPHIIKVSK